MMMAFVFLCEEMKASFFSSKDFIDAYIVQCSCSTHQCQVCINVLFLVHEHVLYIVLYCTVYSTVCTYACIVLMQTWEVKKTINSLFTCLYIIKKYVNLLS